MWWQLGLFVSQLVELSQAHASSAVASTLSASKRPRRMLNQHHSKHRHHETSVRQLLVASGDDLGFQEETSSFFGYSKPEHRTLGRPGAGGSEPSVINFGVFIKDFYGTDLKMNTFRADVITSLKWNDTRVSEVVPAGLDFVVLSDSQAKSKIWVPDMAITNIDIEGVHVISTSFRVHKSGEVSKVERAQVRLINRYDLMDYPFDKQSLKIKIASAKYMSHDLVLLPASNEQSSGLNEQAFGGVYDLRGFEVSVFEDVDGDLTKSRGQFEIKVTRNLDKYVQDHLIPSGIVTVISWAVFYFPFANAFITPRITLSIVSLLTFCGLLVKSTAILPGAAPFNWNDLFNQLIQALMFVAIVINIFSEICYHQFEVESLARRVNHEAKVFLPVLSSLSIAFLLYCGIHKTMSIRSCAASIQLSIIFCLGTYVCWTMKRFRAESAKDMSDTTRHNKE